MSIMEFNPGVQPAFPSTWDVEHPSSRDNPIKKRYGQSIPTSVRPLRTFSLRYQALSRAQLDYILSFFHEIQGDSSGGVDGGIFTWRPPVRTFDPSHRGPDLDQVTLSGAPAGARTYRVGYTWRTSEADPDGNQQESKMSPVSELVVQGGNVLTVTTPVFPNGAESTGIYAVESPDPPRLQVDSVERRWSEDFNGLVPAGALPPAESNLAPLIRCSLIGNYSPSKFRALAHSLTLTFAEEFV
jgi:hypothetical protein